MAGSGGGVPPGAGGGRKGLLAGGLSRGAGCSRAESGLTLPRARRRLAALASRLPSPPGRASLVASGENPDCRDRIALGIEALAGRLAALGAEASGCLLARASAAAMCAATLGRTEAEALALARVRCLAEAALWPEPFAVALAADPGALPCVRLPWRLLAAALAPAAGPEPVTDRALTLRAACRADAPALVDLVEGAYRGERSRRGWTTEAELLDGQRTDLAMVEEMLDDPEGRILVVSSAEGLLGCAHLRRERSHAWFGMFAVRPERQRSGLGSLLLAAAEDHARSVWRCRELRMKVIVQRAELIAWYRRRGYRPTGGLAPFPYGDPRFGIPRRDDLAFAILAKRLRSSIGRGGASESAR
ncbi:MAG: GNAT family N-acetyltransferase [Xanthomonadales bacterium]|nr:GNAT family N-acetyltransferase [Xanthomonadales bacterium]